MQRMFELITKIKQINKYDGFFDDIEEFLKEPTALEQYQAYESAFSCLDQISWGLVSKKAVMHYFDHRRGQLKQGFFNQLNETFAYQFLIHQGYGNVQMITEDKSKKTPDIAYEMNGHKFYCEVKTISISENEIQKWQDITQYDDDEIKDFQDEEGVKIKGIYDHNDYKELSQGFLMQLWNVICDAYHLQIKSQEDNNGEGMVFIIVKFDDFTLTYYERYEEQIIELLHRLPIPEVHIKIYPTENKWIHKKDNHITSS